jgi:hypothetical protein
MRPGVGQRRVRQACRTRLTTRGPVLHALGIAAKGLWVDPIAAGALGRGMKNVGLVRWS